MGKNVSLQSQVKSFQEVLVKMSLAENVQVDDVVINKLANVYGFLAVTLWLRHKDESQVQHIITKFEDVISRTMDLLSIHGVEKLVYNYRKNYTNLYEIHTRQGRKQHLSKKDYVEFLDKVQDGSIKIVDIPSAKKVAKVVKTTSQPSNFMAKLVKLASNNEQVSHFASKVGDSKQTKSIPSNVFQVVDGKAVKKMVKNNVTLKDFFKGNVSNVAPKTPVAKEKKQPVAQKESNKGSFVVASNLSQLEVGKSFVKVARKDKSNVFGRLVEFTASKITVSLHGKQTSISTLDIENVYVYQR